MVTPKQPGDDHATRPWTMNQVLGTMDEKINKYRELARQRAECDVSDLAAVKAANRAGREMDEIAEGIDAADSEAIMAFAALLDDEAARGMAAHHLIKVIRVSGPLADRATAVLKCEPERRIAKAGRAFLKAQASRDQVAMQKCVRRLAGQLGFLLEQSLRSDPTHDWRYEWIDYLTDACVTALSATALRLNAVAVWGMRHTTHEWIAPLMASLQFGEAEDSPLVFRLRFGTKDSEGQLERIDCTQSPSIRDDLIQARPDSDADWWFVFERSG